MRNIKLTIEFDGTNYCGWQIQPNAVSVQETIEKAIIKLTQEKCKVTSSGRTDSSVHAYNMIANFVTNSHIPGDKFSYALNSLLPDDIVIKNSIEVPSDFHARRSAKSKMYKYLIHNADFPSAINRNRVAFVRINLDMGKMNEAAKLFIGSHDFKAFSSTGTDVKDFTRTIYELAVYKKDGLINIDITGNGFLYNMVRIISGTLVEVGKGKIKPADITGIILSKERKNAGKTMPPQGLYLCKVMYQW